MQAWNVLLLLLLVCAVSAVEYPRVIGNRVIDYGDHVFIRLANNPAEISHTMVTISEDDTNTNTTKIPLRAVWNKMFVANQDPQARSSVMAHVVTAQNPLGRVSVVPPAKGDFRRADITHSARAAGCRYAINGALFSMTDGSNYSPLVTNEKLFHRFAPSTSVFGITSDGYAFLGAAGAELASRVPASPWMPGDSATRAPLRDVSMDASIHGLRGGAGVEYDRVYTNEAALQQIARIRAPDWRFQHLATGKGVIVMGGKPSCSADACPSALAEGHDGGGESHTAVDSLTDAQPPAGPAEARPASAYTPQLGDPAPFHMLVTARTAVGVTSDGRLMFVVVDGKSGTSAGITLPELGAFMASLGAHAAVNLDGGGSSTLASRDMVLSTPSDDGVGCYNGQDYNPRSGADGFWHEKKFITSYTARYPRLVREGRLWEYFPVAPTCPRAVSTIICLHDDTDEGPSSEAPAAGSVSLLLYVNVALALAVTVAAVAVAHQLRHYYRERREGSAVTSGGAREKLV